ncbi:MAG: efflux RND transporter periplasmic adaptor subunit [Candidatus Berkelbacteria bacterium]
MKKNKKIIPLIIIIIILMAVIGQMIWKSMNSKIYIDQAQVSASQIKLNSSTGGILKETFAQEGDILPANSIVARVSNEIIKNRTSGQLVKLNDGIGRSVLPGETIATIINPEDLKILAQIAENKGLEYVKPGQQAYFTIDAFGSKKFYGTVTEISPASDEGSLTFKISDKRETKNFDIKISYDHNTYPELKNGMSAKVWIIK